jgi:hypothetical protein
MKGQLNDYQNFMTASFPCRHLISVLLSSMGTVRKLKETLPIFSSETVYARLSITNSTLRGEFEILCTPYWSTFTMESTPYTGITRIPVLFPVALPALVVIQFITS